MMDKGTDKIKGLVSVHGIPPLLREKQIIPGIVPVSRAEWWAGVRAGRYPQPVKLSTRVTCWRAEDIRALVEGRFKVEAGA